MPQGSNRDSTSDRGQGTLTPEEVAYRSFSSARRGISEGEVREFLQQVAAEMADAVGRERDLLARIHELEGRLAHPPPPTEEQILENLGEETARVLRSAQEAAEEIKANANARAQAIIEQAEAEVARSRAAAEAVLADKTREAEVAATVIKREADGKAQAELRQAARDAQAEVEAARQRGRDMVGEARAVRERILADLGRRRSAMQAELEQLRMARDELLGAGRIAKSSLSGIVNALAAFDHATERGPAADAVEVPEGEEAPAEPEADEQAEAEPEPEAEAEAEPEPEVEQEAEAATEREAEAEPEAEPEIEAEPEAEAEIDVELEPEPEPEPEEDAATLRPAVEELFARIRSDRTEKVDQARSVLEVEPEAATAEPVPEEPAPADAGAEEEEVAEEDLGEAAAAADDDELLLARRDDALAPVHEDLIRRCKRALQDEQNELLDRLRRRRRRAATADELLGTFSVQVTDWADVLEPAVDEAYGAGRRSLGVTDPAGSGAPRRLVSALAEALVTPLRERLVATLDAVPGDGADRGTELASRLGARYREWRSQELELRVGDLLATAYTRGIYDAAPEGARLRWVPAAANRCADCDDDALEPTARGSAFPTGQQHPPAHPGCRCLIAVDGE